MSEEIELENMDIDELYTLEDRRLTDIYKTIKWDVSELIKNDELLRDIRIAQNKARYK